MSVEVRFLGHPGNNLFQYALGRILADTHGLALRCLPASQTLGLGHVESVGGPVAGASSGPQGHLPAHGFPEGGAFGLSNADMNL